MPRTTRALGGTERMADRPPLGSPPIAPAYLAKPERRRTWAERAAAGRALRDAVPRELHATWAMTADRPDPVSHVLDAEAGRIPGLLPLRHGRMAATPFAFFRGAGSVMATDLARTAASGHLVQACGDCHLLNFGAFTTPEGRVVFEISDFDESFPAPWEWDLKRLATSVVLVGRANGHGSGEQREAAESAVRAYAATMAGLATMSTIDAWAQFVDWEDVIARAAAGPGGRRRGQVLEQAIARDAAAEFVSLSHDVEGRPRIKDEPPLLYHPADSDLPGFEPRIHAAFDRYRELLTPDRRVLFDRFDLADIAVKVVGVGSVGTLCAVALLLAAGGDAILLQLKQATRSVLEPHVGASPFGSQGERVVFGQRLMQAAGDRFLGPAPVDDATDAYVRQLRSGRVRPMVGLFGPSEMSAYAEVCGRALAQAHARSGDPAVISGYVGKGITLSRAIGEFANAYADQTERDHAAFADAVRARRIAAVAEA